jgi:hypothetical protein
MCIGTILFFSLGSHDFVLLTFELLNNHELNFVNLVIGMITECTVG